MGNLMIPVQEGIDWLCSFLRILFFFRGTQKPEGTPLTLTTFHGQDPDIQGGMVKTPHCDNYTPVFPNIASRKNLPLKQWQHLPLFRWVITSMAILGVIPEGKPFPIERHQTGVFFFQGWTRGPGLEQFLCFSQVQGPVSRRLPAVLVRRPFKGKVRPKKSLNVTECPKIIPTPIKVTIYTNWREFLVGLEDTPKSNRYNYQVTNKAKHPHHPTSYPARTNFPANMNKLLLWDELNSVIHMILVNTDFILLTAFSSDFIHQQITQATQATPWKTALWQGLGVMGEKAQPQLRFPKKTHKWRFRFGELVFVAPNVWPTNWFGERKIPRVSNVRMEFSQLKIISRIEWYHEKMIVSKLISVY